MMVVIRVSPEQTALHYISVLYLAAIEFQLWNQLDLAYCLHVSVLHLRETEVLYLTTYTVVLYQIQYERKFTYIFSRHNTVFCILLLQTFAYLDNLNTDHSLYSLYSHRMIHIETSSYSLWCEWLHVNMSGMYIMFYTDTFIYVLWLTNSLSFFLFKCFLENAVNMTKCVVSSSSFWWCHIAYLPQAISPATMSVSIFGVSFLSATTLQCLELWASVL